MNINITLLEETAAYLTIYGCFPENRCGKLDLERFLFHKGTFSERQQEATRMIGRIMVPNKKERLYDYVSELARVEYAIGKLEPAARDHVVHALLSFLLGIYINEKFLRRANVTPVDDFQWKLASLFHDIGYPVQFAVDALLRPFTDMINQVKRKIGVNEQLRPDVHGRVDIRDLANLDDKLDNSNGFDLIEQRVKEWGLRINVEDEYQRALDKGEIFHGMISSLAVLYVIDTMYMKFNPDREFKDIYPRQPLTRIGDKRHANFNQKYFAEDVVSACAAIYIHDLPPESFSDAKIDRSKARLAWLLKLSDCLQEWERPSEHDKDGFSATQFDINVYKDQLIFHADIPISKKEEMKRIISSTLIASDVRICE